MTSLFIHHLPHQHTLSLSILKHIIECHSQPNYCPTFPFSLTVKFFESVMYSPYFYYLPKQTFLKTLQSGFPQETVLENNFDLVIHYLQVKCLSSQFYSILLIIPFLFIHFLSFCDTVVCLCVLLYQSKTIPLAHHSSYKG